MLDSRRGVLFSSSFEFPGRYTRWDMGFVDPPLVFTARGREFSIEALNAARPHPAAADRRGRRRLTGGFAVEPSGATASPARSARPTSAFPRSSRSRQPSVFSVLRALIDLFGSAEDQHLGLYGAFGYDLVFQFEPMQLRLPRPDDQRDLVLYLPDEILVVDHMRQSAAIHRYEFEVGGSSTAVCRGRPRRPLSPRPWLPPRTRPRAIMGPANMPRWSSGRRAAFARGDLFEVVVGQLFADACADPPSVVFQRLRQANPAPYGALINLGEGEFLVAASPEMYVRVDGRRIETCPISGTIARGRDPVEDAERIRELLNSTKDESELTMCTDVDRNDKSRVCDAGQRAGHRPAPDRALFAPDPYRGPCRGRCWPRRSTRSTAFSSHAWAVTVTGAPKLWAIRFIEEQERSSRRWYGGAIGRVTFDGNMNTGLTLRTIRMQDGVAEVRAGATLLYDSDPQAEEAETRLKASALFAAIRGRAARGKAARGPQRRDGQRATGAADRS